MSEYVKRQYKNGQAMEHEKLILDYLPLVKHVIGRLPIAIPQHMDVEDLFSVGVLGLIHAVQTYDPNRGASFKTYAYTQIRGSILDELRRQDPVPRSQKEKIRLAEKKTEELCAKFGRTPTINELEEATGMSGDELDAVFAAVRAMNILSLDQEFHAGKNFEDGALRNMLKNPSSKCPSEHAMFNEQKRLLADAIENLSPEYRRVIVLYYQRGLYLREIGEILGVTESRVSQIHSRALYLLNQEIKRLGG